jgi:hypothetical protein
VGWGKREDNGGMNQTGLLYIYIYIYIYKYIYIYTHIYIYVYIYIYIYIYLFIYLFMEMLHQNPLYNYHFKKEIEWATGCIQIAWSKEPSLRR